MDPSPPSKPRPPLPPIAPEWGRLLPSAGPFGDATRSSRAAVLPRRLDRLDRIVDLAPAPSPPRYVAPSPAGREIAIGYEGFHRRFTLDGARLGEASGEVVIAFPDGISVDGEDRSSIPRRYEPDVASGVPWAIARSPDLFVSIFHLPSVLLPHEGLTPPMVRLEVHARNPVNGRLRLISTLHLDGDGGGAVAHAPLAVLFTTRGRLQIVSFADVPTGAVEVDAALPFRPLDLALTSAGCAFLSRGAGGASALHVVGRAGEVRWEAALPFAAAAPPVEGGGGRVYVAGDGLSALENGRAIWSLEPGAPVRAAAFADGSLAITVGPELRLLDREGACRIALRTPDGAPFTSRPAIGADGSVWAATAEALFVARASS